MTGLLRNANILERFMDRTSIRINVLDFMASCSLPDFVCASVPHLSVHCWNFFPIRCWIFKRIGADLFGTCFHKILKWEAAAKPQDEPYCKVVLETNLIWCRYFKKNISQERIERYANWYSEFNSVQRTVGYCALSRTESLGCHLDFQALSRLSIG